MDEIKFLRTDYSGKIKSGGHAITDMMMILDELVNSGETPVGLVFRGHTVEVLCEDASE